jgi:NAD(P)-dependent dehydrogenase (short-subunit alcohol dehydrogenase family)
MTHRAIVTGASGFIRTALVRYLRSEGWGVVAVDRKPFRPDQPARLVDVARRALDGLLDDRTVVFHMAASADVAASVANPATISEHVSRGVRGKNRARRAAGWCFRRRPPSSIRPTRCAQGRAFRGPRHHAPPASWAAKPTRPITAVRR